MEKHTAPNIPDASNLASQALADAESRRAEAPSEPTTAVHTIEDYVDSEEALKVAKRILAKAYQSYMSKSGESVSSANDLGRETTLELPASTKQSFERTRRATISRERPNWEAHFPKDDSAEELAMWEQFVMGFEDITVQNGLQHLYKVSQQHEAIAREPQLRPQIEQYSEQRLRTMRFAATYRHLERQEEALYQQIQELHARAMVMGEASWPDKHLIQELKDKIAVNREARESLLISDEIIEEIERRRHLDAKKQLDSGVLMTLQMSDVERKNISALLGGAPLLLVGETGGAKTALARHMARTILELTGKSGLEAEMISGFGEINVYQLMGKNELRGDKTEFIPGPLVRAMQEGRPVILDEINSIPPDIMKRLNVVMQLRPGDRYTIQEDNGLAITVKPGFCIIATMNEKSHRYRGVESLSSEFRDRFGVNVAQIGYPDQDIPPGGDAVPETLLQLALLVCTDRNTGKINIQNMTEEELFNFVRVAHFTQYMFTHPANDPAILANLANSSRLAVDGASGKTGLSTTTITPRTMVQIIEKVTGGSGKISLQEALSDFLGRVDDPTDKAIIQQLFENYSLLPIREER